MIRRVACIVEGHGEIESLPLLLRRVYAEDDSLCMPDIRQNDVIRIPRSRLLRPNELERAVELAARRVEPAGAVLVLVDADEDPPCKLAPELLERALAVRPNLLVAVVLASREFESWFLAAARSLAGRRGLPTDLEPPHNPESIRDAKGWLHARMLPGGYRPAVHQAKLTALMNLQQARSARSFDKLLRDVRRLLAASQP